MMAASPPSVWCHGVLCLDIWGLQSRQNPMIPILSGRNQSKHPLQVSGQGHEVPFTGDLIEPAQQQLAEAEHGLIMPNTGSGSVCAA
jgi:hypothetical protein